MTNVTKTDIRAPVVYNGAVGVRQERLALATAQDVDAHVVDGKPECLGKRGRVGLLENVRLATSKSKKKVTRALSRGRGRYCRPERTSSDPKTRNEFSGHTNQHFEDGAAVQLPRLAVLEICGVDLLDAATLELLVLSQHLVQWCCCMHVLGNVLVHDLGVESV
jgi:hypothetical protein